MVLPLAAVGVGLSAVSLVSGFLSSRSAQKAAKREEERRQQLLARIQKAASPENFKKILGTLRPIFREAAMQNIGPAVESTVATQLGRRDLTGTGLGQVLTGLAPSVAGSQALNLATSEAGRQQGAQIDALGAGLGVGAGTAFAMQGANPLGDSLNQTARLIADIRGIPGQSGSDALATRLFSPPPGTVPFAQMGPTPFSGDLGLFPSNRESAPAALPGQAKSTLLPRATGQR